MMTRKHYNAIAERIAQAMTDTRQFIDPDHGEVSRTAINSLAVSLSHDFKADNPSFNRDRFLNACGCVH